MALKKWQAMQQLRPIFSKLNLMANNQCCSWNQVT